MRISEVRDYETCPRLRHFAWVEGLVPRTLDMKLHLGSAVHAGLAAYYRGENPHQALDAYVAEALRSCQEQGIDYDPAAIEERAKVGHDLLDAYVEWATVNDSTYRRHTVLVEQRAVVPIRHPKTGKKTGFYQDLQVDGVWEDHYGHLWLVEHKTTGSGFPSEDWLRLDPQTGSYLLALEELYPSMRVVGVLHNYLRVPREGGTVAGMKTDKVKRFRVIWNEHARQRMRERLYNTVKKMVKETDHDPAPYLCKYWSCRFASLCVGAEDGSNVEELKKALFARKEVDVCQAVAL